MKRQGKTMVNLIVKNDKVRQSVGLDAALARALAQAPEMTPHPPLLPQRAPSTASTPGGHPPAPFSIPVFPTPFSLFGVRPAGQEPNRDFGTRANGVGGCTHA